MWFSFTWKSEEKNRGKVYVKALLGKIAHKLLTVIWEWDFLLEIEDTTVIIYNEFFSEIPAAYIHGEEKAELLIILDNKVTLTADI